MERIGLFKVEQSFKITGRDRIVTGQIVDGKIKTGSYTYLEVEEKSYLCRITGVDMGSYNTKGELFMGLLLYNQEINLEDYQIKPQSIEILETKSTE